MIRTKIDLSDEKKLLTNMITSTEFLRKIQPLVDPKLFESKYASIVAGWILEFFKYTEVAPERAIQDIYSKKGRMVKDEDIRESIGDYLSHLSKQWEKNQINNVDYSYINAVEYLRLRSLDVLIEKIQSCKNRQDPAAGEALIAGYRRVEKPEGLRIDLFKDTKVVRDALEQTGEVLFNMPGAMGRSMGPILRDSLIAFNAPPKRGKSWHMMDLGFRAALAGCNVWFVSMEMDRGQTIRRWWSCFNGAPIKTGNHKLPKFKDLKDGTYDVEYDTKQIEGMSSITKDIDKKQKQYTMACGNATVKLDIFPTNTMRVSDLEAELDNMAFYDNFVPDIIIADYADIMVHDGKILEKRHQLDNIWKNLRALAQKRNVCVCTGSQTGRNTSKKDADADDISEAWSKNAHVTLGVFLNQSKEEKANKIMRMECSLKREGATYANQVVILQGLGIGRPHLDSQFRKNVNKMNNDDNYGI